MKVAIIGLGLIGGSFAKAYKASGHYVIGHDTDEITLGWATLADIIDERLDDNNIKECDLILIAVTPQNAGVWLENNSERISAKTFVIDLCGTKRSICRKGFAIAEKYGFTFVGGHPMAGHHLSGIKNSRVDMFRDETMVIVPPRHDDIALFDKIEQLLRPAGFNHFTISTAEKHDVEIAFTSQLAHVVSNAYVKSPVAQRHRGISAGSYKDLTRVAWLNEKMWTELFLDNRDNLCNEISLIIDSLTEYKTAMENNDAETLERLLKEGREAKERADG